MCKTLATRGSVAPGSSVMPALPGWLAVGAGPVMAAPESFIEPAVLGWPAAPFSPEVAAPGFGGAPEPELGLRACRQR
jgi:hypothetical protein